MEKVKYIFIHRLGYTMWEKRKILRVTPKFLAKASGMTVAINWNEQEWRGVGGKNKKFSIGHVKFELRNKLIYTKGTRRILSPESQVKKTIQREIKCQMLLRKTGKWGLRISN